MAERTGEPDEDTPPPGDAPAEAPRELVVRPIGLARTPFVERADAPRQAVLARGVRGTIELFDFVGVHDALEDVASWERLWVIFWFHRARGFRPKVTPPRSRRRRGLFATRAPYRPNPIGLSSVRLLGVEGRRLHVEELDLIDGTPVLDLKPYVAYADAFPTAGTGWLAAEARQDDEPRWEVSFSPDAEAQLAFLEARGVALRAPILAALETSPHPHAYRRIKREGDGFVLGIKSWRASFGVADRAVCVASIDTGYKARDLADDTDEAAIHRAFLAFRRAARP